MTSPTGPGHSKPLDAISRATGTGTALDSGALTTSHGRETLISPVRYMSASGLPAGGTFTRDPLYTRVGYVWTQSGTNDVAVAIQHRGVTSTGSYSAAGTLSSAYPWAQMLLGYQAAP